MKSVHPQQILANFLATAVLVLLGAWTSRLLVWPMPTKAFSPPPTRTLVRRPKTAVLSPTKSCDVIDSSSSSCSSSRLFFFLPKRQRLGVLSSSLKMSTEQAAVETKLEGKGVLANNLTTTSTAIAAEFDHGDDHNDPNHQDQSATRATANNKTPPPPTFGECLAFALPALGIYLCSPLMSLIDAAFVGRRRSSSLELAALGPASSISDCAPLPLLFLSIGATNLIAREKEQENGAGGGNTKEAAAVEVANDDDDDESSNTPPAMALITRTALGMGTVGGLVLAALLYPTAGALSALYCGGAANSSPPSSSSLLVVAGSCRDYVSIRALALPAVVVTTVAQAVCLGNKDTVTPMMSVLSAAAVNLLGDVLLVPRHGIVGAAWATAASQVLSAALLLRVLQKKGFLNKPAPAVAGLETAADPNSSSNNKTVGTVAWQLLSFVPFLFVMAVKIGWHNSCAATAASLGGVQAAAHTAVVSVAMLCMVLGDVGSSLSQAFLPAFTKECKNNVVVVVEEDNNNNNNNKNKNGSAVTKTKTTTTTTHYYFDLKAAMPTIRQLLKCTLSISVTAMGMATILIGGGIITSDPLVSREMRRILPWIVATLSFHGSAVTLEGLLLSRQQFRGLAVCYSALAVAVATFQWAIRRFRWGLDGVWACYLFFCMTRVVAFSILGGLFGVLVEQQQTTKEDTRRARLEVAKIPHTATRVH